MGHKQPQLSAEDKALQIIDTLRAETTAAREAYQDLRSCMKEFTDLIDTRADSILNAALSRDIDEIHAIMNRLVDCAMKSTLNRWYELSDMLMNSVKTYGHALRSAQRTTAAERLDMMTEALQSLTEITDNRARFHIESGEVRIHVDDRVVTRFPGQT